MLKEQDERTGRELKVIVSAPVPPVVWSSVDATSSLQDGAPSHHHTVHLGSAAPCIHCSRSKRPPLVRQGRSKEGKGRPRPGETTVFSVGRWGIVVQEKRLNWGPGNPVPQGGAQFFLLNNWATTAGVRLHSVPQSQKASLPQVTEAAIKPREGGLGSL